MKNLITLTCKYTTLLLLVPSLLYAASVWAAAPPSGEVSANQQQATWTGGPLIATAAATCNGPDNPSCDNFALTITAPTFPFQVQISITASAADDWDLEVYDPSGVLIGTSANGAGSVETVVLNNPASGTYTVSVSPFAPVGPYTGAANLEPVGGGGGGGAVEAGNLPILNYGPPGASGDDPDYQLFGPVAGEQGLGLGAGEPTTGIPIVNNLDLQLTDPDLTRQMYISGLETLRVTYNDCTVPAVALWEDKSVPTHATTLDPILNVDSATGRTFS
ncbi:MAG: PPC domain-containing protein [Gammaproteobacteria bacterium]|nr:PPC domain-containing protein [Gammaproteobacteria bacterium]